MSPRVGKDNGGAGSVEIQLKFGWNSVWIDVGRGRARRNGMENAGFRSLSLSCSLSLCVGHSGIIRGRWGASLRCTVLTLALSRSAALPASRSSLALATSRSLARIACSSWVT